MIRFAVLSRWHPHADRYANEIQNHPDCEIACIWDENAERGKEWAKELNVEFIEDYNEILNREDIDAICCTAPTSMHKDLFIKAAQHGKHIFTEKVLCSTKKDALEVKKVIDQTKVKFVISYPMRDDGRMLFAKKLIADQTLGQINYLRIRNCHDGVSGGWLPDFFLEPETTGGGAMMDLGAHPMYLCSWFLGEPVNIQSCFTKVYNKPVDDNCVSVIEFANGTIAVSETGFVTSSAPFSLELSGTHGTFITGGFENKSYLKIPGSELKVIDTKCIKAVSAFDQFVSAIIKDTPIDFNIDEAVKLSELMDGAYRSWKENRKVSFKEF